MNNQLRESLKRNPFLLGAFGLLFLSFALLGCSGGGSSEASVSQGVRIFHAAVDATPVDLYSSDQPGALLQRTYFAQELLRSKINKVAQILTISIAKLPNQELFALNRGLDQDQQTTLMLCGDREQTGLRLVETIDNPGPLGVGESAVKVGHGVNRAGEIVVRLQQTAGVNGEELLGAPVELSTEFGTFTGYLKVPAGTYTVLAVRKVDLLPLFSGSFYSPPNKSVTILGGGEAEYFTKFLIVED